MRSISLLCHARSAGKAHLWIGTLDGLNRLDRATGTVLRGFFHNAPKDPQSLGHDFVSHIGEDHVGA